MSSAEKQLYYRLIALWAVCEGVLGGIIHGFQLPVSGLIVGSAAVIIICMIGYFVPVRGSILTATLFVEIFKMMLSPQSPLPAYFAVFFQGITGELFFLNRKLYKISCVVFATIALFESAVQRIITMTLIYGAGFWKAVNDFINGITHTEEVTNYSLYIVGGYILLHIIVGIAIGVLAAGIPSKLKNWKQEKQLTLDLVAKEEVNEMPVETRRSGRKTRRNSLLIIWIILLLLFIQSSFGIGKPLLASGEILQILVRSFLILLTWYFLVSPLLMYFLKNWLAKKKERSESVVNEILNLIPSTRLLLERSWKRSGDKRGFQRLNKFLKIVLVNSLDEQHD